MDVNEKKDETEVVKKNMSENVEKEEIVSKTEDAKVAAEANGDHIKHAKDGENAKTANVSLPISDKENGVAKHDENAKDDKNAKDDENAKTTNVSLPISDKENGVENAKHDENAKTTNVSLPISNKENSVENGKENVKESEKIDKCLSNENGNEIATKIEKGESSSSSSPTNAKDRDLSLISDENAFVADLKEYEKRALLDLKSKLEEAILTHKLFKKAKNNEEKIEEESSDKITDENEKQDIVADKGKDKMIVTEKDDKADEEVDKDIALWGVPLLPSKGDSATDILLFKFLVARDFKPNDAFEMLRNTLEWRKENKIDSITEEELSESFYDTVGYMKGLDREGHPVCYNVYGVFDDEATYNKTFGTEASREKFLRWRLQLLEKEIRKLDFRHGGVSKLLQINDLKNAPGPSRRDLRLATKRAVGILQDNYPEFVSRNIFINVPFWYYAFNAILSPFLTQRTKSKFVFSRPSRVTETLLKYIAAEEIPIIYGGLQRENDPDFSTQDAASEVNVKAGTTENIEIPAPEVGNSLMWDLTIVGWDVNYKEEFVPTDEGSYTVIVKKGRKISWQHESIRNTFANKEPGKVVITIENSIFKKKRVFYRYKIKNNHASSS
ncbi:hypothetical protein ABFS82_08G160800 [Erythranthe guttata]|uniref:patellin-4-like n=1 Tax=Erythranthe guttata TaxID=4155 RepID=UPI00064DE329|nr:PREDICTED: patellin-4-like [Erythranthe guttata]|eukprot:XP_012841607.1 PREDICTED: patellin-4-like [Erythranthe guttata]